MKESHLKSPSQRELEYQEFIDMLGSRAFGTFRNYLETIISRYEKDVTIHLRAKGSNEEAGQKARLAQAMRDTIENVLTTHIEALKRDLSPSLREDGPNEQVY